MSSEVLTVYTVSSITSSPDVKVFLSLNSMGSESIRNLKSRVVRCMQECLTLISKYFIPELRFHSIIVIVVFASEAI